MPNGLYKIAKQTKKERERFRKEWAQRDLEADRTTKIRKAREQQKHQKAYKTRESAKVWFKEWHSTLFSSSHLNFSCILLSILVVNGVRFQWRRRYRRRWRRRHCTNRARDRCHEEHLDLLSTRQHHMYIYIFFTLSYYFCLIARVWYSPSPNGNVRVSVIKKYIYDVISKFDRKANGVWAHKIFYRK